MKEYCPYCKKDIGEEIYQDWVGDYRIYYDFKCPKCGEMVKIDVRTEPVFILGKSDNPKIP